MAWDSVTDRSKIAGMLKELVSAKSEIKVSLTGEPESFFSRITSFKKDKEGGKPARLLIEKLAPDKGNLLLQSSSDLILEFFLNEKACRCRVEYAGTSNTPPHFGHIVSFPQLVEFRERRREKRFVYNTPEFVSVEFSLKAKGKRKIYELNVHDCSSHGLGILVTKKDFDLIEILRPGDKLEDITFYSESAIIRVSGIVRHMTRLRAGKYKGSFILGIESPDIIESCKPIRNGE